MNEYLLSVCYPSASVQPGPEALAKIKSDAGRVLADMQAAGVFVFSSGLQSSAFVVRPRDGEFVTTDGPFIESKEMIGGICIVRAADLDEALGWARNLSRATTTPIEVKPFSGTCRPG